MTTLRYDDDDCGDYDSHCFIPSFVRLHIHDIGSLGAIIS